MSLHSNRRIAVVVALLVLAPATASAQVPVLEATATGVTDGHVQLSWEPVSDGAEIHHFQLQEADTAAFEEALLRYEGTERGSFVSGLPRGRHFYRVRQRRTEDDPWGPWSEPLAVDIEPYSLGVAWALFSTGGMLVAAILGFLFVADRRARGRDV